MTPSIRSRIAGKLAPPGDPGIPELRAPRSRATMVALVALPIVGNLLLAAVLFTTLPPRPGGSGGALPFVPVPVEPARAHNGVLPVAGVGVIIASVQASTDGIYRCNGPWAGGGGTLNWACRARDSVATLQGTADGKVFLIRTTWFGFDPADSDLETWSDAIFATEALRDQSRQWLREHFGRRASTSFGRTVIQVGGSRGAYTMTIFT